MCGLGTLETCCHSLAITLTFQEVGEHFRRNAFQRPYHQICSRRVELFLRMMSHKPDGDTFHPASFGCFHSRDGILKHYAPFWWKLQPLGRHLKNLWIRLASCGVLAGDDGLEKI